MCRFKGLTSEDMLVYQAIQQAANTGIWTADLKKRTNLQQLQVNKALKNLESRSLVKPVKTVSNKNRKVYMLFELDPSREVTGGAWYTEQDYDAEFVDVVKQQCLHFILKQGRNVCACRDWPLWRMLQNLFASLVSLKLSCD
jgi:DNA-directed RNA polymerase III subunit RPC6